MSLLPLASTDPAQAVAALADQCVMCGLCQPHCPTYRIARNEAESPRGRIALARALARGDLLPEPGVLQHLAQCLGCMSCERVCPSQVEYGRLLVATRQLTRVHAPPAAAWLRALLSRPGSLRLAIGLAHAVRARAWLLPLLRRAAPRSTLATLLQELPALPRQDRYPASPRLEFPRSRIGLMLGCVAASFDRDTLQASRHLLQALGYEVVSPAQQGCCGAMALHAGDTHVARRQAQRMRDAFEGAGVTAVIVAASGCHGTLRDLTLAGSTMAVHEIHNFLAADPAFAQLRFRPLAQRAALHLPCTAVNVSRSAAAISTLLSRIPQLQLLALPEQPRCCGAAGTYFLEHVDIAVALRREKLDQCATLAPDVLLTANIGCRIHLGNGLRERGTELPVLHPVTLLARQLDAQWPESHGLSTTIAGS